MLSLWKRKPEPTVEPQQQAGEVARRNQQLNLKVSEDCSAHFAALAKAQGLSKAALFEDLVAERLNTLQKRGLKLEVR